MASGWEFGRPVLKAELGHLVEEVPGVEGVDGLDIRDEQRNVGVEHLRLDDDELPFPRPRPHRGEGPRRHRSRWAPNAGSTASVVRVPDVDRAAASTRRSILLEDAGLHAGRHAVPRELRGRATRSSSSVRRADRWCTRAPRSPCGSRAAAALEHLPAIYRRSDAVGRNLVRGICFLFEHMFDSVELRLDRRLAASTIRTSRRSTSSTGSRSWSAFTLDLDWPGAEEARAASSAPSTSTGSAAPARPCRCSSGCSRATSPDIEENTWPFKGFRVEGRAPRGRSHQPRLGGPAAGGSGPLLRGHDADQVRGR